jgi:anti-anti-sigma factor
MSLDIGVLRKEGENNVIIKLSGQLDTESHTQLTEKGRQVMSGPATGLVLDLEDLEYISSMGISSIMTLKKLCDEKGAGFVMVNVPAQIEKVFEIVKALPDVRVFESMQEADRYFMEIQKRAKDGQR